MPIRNAPSALPTTLRFIGSRLAHRLRGGVSLPEPEKFRRRLELALEKLGDRVLRCDFIEVRSDGPDWLDSGLVTAAGSNLSLLVHGRLHLSRAFDVGFGPGLGLWYRLGEAELANVVGGADSVHSAAGGIMRFTTKPPGEFADRRGSFEADRSPKGIGGGFLVAVIQWRGDLDAALVAAAEADTELFGPALARRRNPVRPPNGWHYLWRLGEGEIYSGTSQDSELCCHTHADVGILQFPVKRALTPETRLSWSWCVEQLPSKLPEHIQPTHDYLSIAVEFDNGLDLTWMWSVALPVDTIFQCPLPWWDQRETHWVIRSGTSQLGTWLDESRPLLADYEKAIGGPVPGNIVAVWLIANTVFQRGVGKCRYREIALEDADGRAVVQA